MKQLPGEPESPNVRVLAQVYRETFTGITGDTVTLAYTPVTTVNDVGLEQIYKNGVLMGATGSGGGTQVRELRDNLAGDISSLFRLGGIVFADVSPGTHSLHTGNEVHIDGATQPDYNGDFTITVTSTSTFTYGISTTPTTPAVGAPTYGAITFDLEQTPNGEPELLFRSGALVSPEGGAIGYVRTGTSIRLGTAVTSASRVVIWYRTGGGGYAIADKVVTFDTPLVAGDVIVAHYSYRN